MTDGGGDSGRVEVFVSCARDGLPWAEWIAWQLEEAGMEARIAAWDVMAGTHKTSWLDGVTQRARHTIAVASDDYLDSPELIAEWASAWSPRIFDGERRLLVARVTDRPIPGLLGQLAPVNLADRGEIGARLTLLAAVRGEQYPERQATVGHPGAEGVRLGGSRGGAVFPGDLPAVWNLPRLPFRFMGRDESLSRLDTAMSAGPVVAVTGLAGIGKTSLAVEYIRENRGSFEAVWWVPANRPDLIEDKVRGLARDLGLPADAGADQVLDRLDTAGGRWLLVLDNADHRTTLPPWLHGRDGAGRILVTSRTAGWDGDGAGGARAVPVESMSRAESVALLTDRRPTIDQSIADRIAARLGDHPLALEQAAHQIGRVPAEVYLTALMKGPVNVLARGEVPGRPGVNAATLWDEPLRQLDVETPAAASLLRLAAHGDAVPLPLSLLVASPDAIASPELRAAVNDPWDLADAVAALESAGLAHRDGDALSMHLLVRDVARARTPPIEVAQQVDALSRMLHAGLPERIAAAPDAWPAWRAYLPHALATLEATAPAADTPHTAWLAEHAAVYHIEHGRPDLAEPLAARAVDAHVRLDGQDHPDTLAARETHIRAALNAGNIPFAGPLAERNVADRARTLGETHPDTLTSRETLARVYQQAGHLDHAEAQFRQNLADRTTTLGPDHPDTLESQHRLGAVLDDSHRSSEAVAILRPTLVTRDRILGPTHPDTLNTRYELAISYQRMGAFGDALGNAEPTLDARVETLGEAHPQTLDSRHRVGVTYLDVGRLAEAEQLLGDALATRDESLGKSHPSTLDSAHALGRVHLASGSPDKAAPLFDRAAIGRSELYGPDHPKSTASREQLAAAYLEGDHLKDAAPHLELVLDRHERILGKTHPSALETRGSLVQIYRVLGQGEAAEYHLDRQITATASEDVRVDRYDHVLVPEPGEIERDSAPFPPVESEAERVNSVGDGRPVDGAARSRDVFADAMREHGPFHPDTIRARWVVAENSERSHTDRESAIERPATPDTDRPRLER